MSAPLVLVVDDEELIRMTLTEFLLHSGFEVLEAEQADEALEILHANSNVAAVITDVRMPGGKDGFELAREAAALARDIRILVMSGHVEAVDKSLPPGAAFYSKPFNCGLMVENLKAALASG